MSNPADLALKVFVLFFKFNILFVCLWYDQWANFIIKVRWHVLYEICGGCVKLLLLCQNMRQNLTALHTASSLRSVNKGFPVYKMGLKVIQTVSMTVLLEKVNSFIKIIFVSFLSLDIRTNPMHHKN